VKDVVIMTHTYSNNERYCYKCM